MSVFVIDKKGRPWIPCSEKRARLLLVRSRARIHQLNPFTIRLVDRWSRDVVVSPVAQHSADDPASRPQNVE